MDRVGRETFSILREVRVGGKARSFARPAHNLYTRLTAGGTAIHMSSSQVYPDLFIYENAYGEASTFPEPFMGMERMYNIEGLWWERCRRGMTSSDVPLSCTQFPDVRYGEGCGTADIHQDSIPRASGIGSLTREPVESTIPRPFRGRPGSAVTPDCLGKFDHVSFFFFGSVEEKPSGNDFHCGQISGSQLPPQRLQHRASGINDLDVLWPVPDREHQSWAEEHLLDMHLYWLSTKMVGRLGVCVVLFGSMKKISFSHFCSAVLNVMTRDRGIGGEIGRSGKLSDGDTTIKELSWLQRLVLVIAEAGKYSRDFGSSLVKSMRVFKQKLKFKFRLRTFLRRVKRRGKPYPVSLLTLPNELFHEIAYFLADVLATSIVFESVSGGRMLSNTPRPTGGLRVDDQLESIHVVFRNIRKFSLTGYQNNSTPTIERTLARGIHIPSITLKSRGVPSAVIDYLVSNEGMVELTFEVETDRGNVSRRLLSEVVLRHFRTLEVLQLTSCWGSHWAVGCLPEYCGGWKQRLHMLSLLRILRNLQTLRLVAHTNDFTPDVKRIECICNDESLLKRLQVVVSVSYLGRIKFEAGQSGWDFDDEEPDVL
ncbi:hypothetical protein ARMGADRAFT_1040739 [Armillaria gallica]|uniref:Uncharacterized protein n=1 Tax=Armillaria gallica TaxID=47427 RepID=A0A2H3CW45_ARMGA|nr:hypothetical protein ARMGADRAFT_1040739 [Armillaria gallica]